MPYFIIKQFLSQHTCTIKNIDIPDKILQTDKQG